MPGLAGAGELPSRGHDDADESLLRAFVAALRSEDWSVLPTDAHDVAMTHLATEASVRPT